VRIGRIAQEQGRAPGFTAALHAGHTTSNFEPHCSQNAASVALAVLQDGHSIADHADNSSSSALASFRSTVSKPSVNQL